MKDLTEELKPAYERPVDQESIDRRMNAQLQFENGSAPMDETTPDVKSASSPNRRGGSLKRKLAVSALAVGGAAMLMAGVERADDQQQTFYRQPSSEMPALKHTRTVPLQPEAPNASEQSPSN